MVKRLALTRFFAGLCLLTGLNTACAGDLSENDCLQMKQEVTAFALESIIPLAESEEFEGIDWRIVAEIKDLRRKLQSCSFSEKLPSHTPWNETEIARLDGRLAFFEVTFEQAAEQDDPEVTRMLFNTQGFDRAVQRLREALDLGG